jgi:hypothetical protein
MASVGTFVDDDRPPCRVPTTFGTGNVVSNSPHAASEGVGASEAVLHVFRRSPVKERTNEQEFRWNNRSLLICCQITDRPPRRILTPLGFPDSQVLLIGGGASNPR